MWTTVTECCRPAPGKPRGLDADADDVDPLGCADPPPAGEPGDEPPPFDAVEVVCDALGGGVVVEGTDVVVGRDGVLRVGVVGSGLVGNGLVGRGGAVTDTDVVGTGSVGTTSARATRAPSPAQKAATSNAASLRLLPRSIILITPFGRFWLRAK